MSRRLAVLLLAGIALVAGYRLVNPTAPPLYDGIPIQIEPYHYVSPPPALASSNKTPSSGETRLSVVDGVSNFGTAETKDRQVLAFFPKGAFPKLAVSEVVIRIDPVADPPPAPAGATMVGNAYSITAVGITPAAPLPQSAQVLLRVPPLRFTGVKVYYEAAWHDAQWGAQSDYANITMTHLGDLAAFSDPHKPTQQVGGIGPAQIFEIAAVILAVIVIAIGIITSRRRRQAPAE